MTTQVGKLNGEVSRIKGEVKKYKEEASSLSNELSTCRKNVARVEELEQSLVERQTKLELTTEDFENYSTKKLRLEGKEASLYIYIYIYIYIYTHTHTREIWKTINLYVELNKCKYKMMY